MDQPCRMDDCKIPATTSVVYLPRSDLKGTEKKVFGVVATELIHNRLSNLVGVNFIEAYARKMGLYHDMTRVVEREGHTIGVEIESGLTTVINPERKVAESALTNTGLPVSG